MTAALNVPGPPDPGEQPYSAVDDPRRRRETRRVVTRSLAAGGLLGLIVWLVLFVVRGG